MKLTDMTPAERKRFYHERQLRAAATRRANNPSSFADSGRKGGQRSKRRRQPMEQ